MNPKFAVALMLALQVSMSLCELPTPSAELVQKYDGIKVQAETQLFRCWDKLKQYITVRFQSLMSDPTIKTGYEAFKKSDDFQALSNFTTALHQHREKILEPLRKGLLGLYQQHARGTMKKTLDDHINQFIKTLECSCSQSQ